ncbi:MAG TPA: VOC family protein [Candidatus Solibacter sp.]|nr:VOC family protein [Candidatus Solibacter sp.]
MIENRSVPPDTVLPHVVYQDLVGAIAWLNAAFGFREHYRYGAPSGAQVHLGNAWMMLRQAREGSASPAKLGCATQSLTVFIEDVEAHYQRAKAAGAKIVEEPHTTEYGEFQYGAEDLEGHHWLFARHAKDVSPDAWGATIVESARRLELLRRPRFCYVEIPAIDVQRSVEFYEKVFGWNIRHRESERPSFDDATGNISGAWVTGRASAREPGLLSYIWVDDIEATLARIRESGGEIVEAGHPDSPGGSCLIATFRDPAGNLIGLYQENAG